MCANGLSLTDLENRSSDNLRSDDNNENERGDIANQGEQFCDPFFDFIFMEINDRDMAFAPSVDRTNLTRVEGPTMIPMKLGTLTSISSLCNS